MRRVSVADSNSVIRPTIRLLADLFVALNDTPISFPKNFVPPSVIDLVTPLDKTIPFCKHLEPSNRYDIHY